MQRKKYPLEVKGVTGLSRTEDEAVELSPEEIALYEADERSMRAFMDAQKAKRRREPDSGETE